MSARVEQEVARLALHLDMVIRFHRENHRSIERKLGWSVSYLNKLIRGASPLRVEHILAVLEVLGEDPTTFFRAAYPTDRPLPRTAQDALAAFEAAKQPAESADDQLQARFSAGVRQALLELLTATPEASSAKSKGK